MGTSEVEFYREVQGEPGGWRGPALLLRLDTEEGTAVIQYQGRPYLVAIRHIRLFRGIFVVLQRNLRLNFLYYVYLALWNLSWTVQGSLHWLAETTQWKMDPLPSQHVDGERDHQEG